MKRLCVMTLALMVLLMHITLWTTSGGLIDLLRTRRAMQVQTADNEAAANRNTLLVAEVKDLKQGTEAIEERAREELGFIKPGEVFYSINSNSR